MPGSASSIAIDIVGVEPAMIEALVSRDGDAGRMGDLAQRRTRAKNPSSPKRWSLPPHAGGSDHNPCSSSSRRLTSSGAAVASLIVV